MSIVVTAPTSSVVLPYTEIALNPATWDLVVPKTLLFGADAIVQRLRVRFGFWLGEWFLDTTQGAPYRERVFIKSAKVPTIVAMFRKITSTTPGVVAVPSCSLGAIDGRTRSAALTFVAKLGNGSAIIAVNEPFVVLNT